MASNILRTCVNHTVRYVSNFLAETRITFFSSKITQDVGNYVVAVGAPIETFSVTGLQQVRYRMKDYFRRPSEFKRIRRHGWKVRMSTPAGRMVIMRRMLKGRHILTH